MNILDQNTIDKIFTEEFFVHFDLEWWKHQIPISQSIATEQSIQTIIQEINKHIFDNKLEIQIFIDPAEPWSHLKKTIIWIWIVIWSIIWPDIVNWAVMALWDWRDIKELTRDWTIQIKWLIKWFFEKSNQELIDWWINPDIFYKAYKAKNNFYKANIENREVKWIGFDQSENFPINRTQFWLRVLLDEKLSKIDPIDKFHELIVVSSIITEEDRKLSWQVKDKKIKKRFDIYMSDKSFYDWFLKKPFMIKKMIVKVRYTLKRNEEWIIEIEKKEIIKVYEYNDTKIKELPKWATIEPAPRKSEWYSLQDHNPNWEWTLFEWAM